MLWAGRTAGIPSLATTEYGTLDTGEYYDGRITDTLATTRVSLDVRWIPGRLFRAPHHWSLREGEDNCYCRRRRRRVDGEHHWVVPMMEEDLPLPGARMLG